MAAAALAVFFYSSVIWARSSSCMLGITCCWGGGGGGGGIATAGCCNEFMSLWTSSRLKYFGPGGPCAILDYLSLTPMYVVLWCCWGVDWSWGCFGCTFLLG